MVVHTRKLHPKVIPAKQMCFLLDFTVHGGKINPCAKGHLWESTAKSHTLPRSSFLKTAWAQLLEGISKEN